MSAKANAPCSPPPHKLSNCCPIRRGSAKRRSVRIIDALIASYRHDRLPGTRCCAFEMFHKTVTAVRREYLSLSAPERQSWTWCRQRLCAPAVSAKSKQLKEAVFYLDESIYSRVLLGAPLAWSNLLSGNTIFWRSISPERDTPHSARVWRFRP